MGLNRLDVAFLTDTDRDVLVLQRTVVDFTQKTLHFLVKHNIYTVDIKLQSSSPHPANTVQQRDPLLI